MKTPAFLQTILDTARLSGRHVAGLRGDIRSRLDAFRRHRSAEEQRELTVNFHHVLIAWGIADADIPGVISALRLRLPVFVVPVLACLSHYGGMVSQSDFLPGIGLYRAALSSRHCHDALAHFHSTSPSLYAAVPLAVAVPQASVAGGVCLS